MEVSNDRCTRRAEKLSDAAAERVYGRALSSSSPTSNGRRKFYEKVFGGQVLSRGDSRGAPGYIQIANTWLIVNVGGGPTPDKPTVTLSVPPDPDAVSSFMNIRVADIHACYELWRSRGAKFITEPKDEVRRDALLHPRPGRLHYRSRAEQAGLHLRLNGTAQRRGDTGASGPGLGGWLPLMQRRSRWCRRLLPRVIAG